MTFGAKSHIGGMLATGSYRMDQWIVGAVAGSRELGLYAIAVAWFEGLFILPMAVAATARPDLVMAKRAEAGEKIASLFRMTVALTLIAAIALVVSHRCSVQACSVRASGARSNLCACWRWAPSASRPPSSSGSG